MGQASFRCVRDPGILARLPPLKPPGFHPHAVFASIECMNQKSRFVFRLCALPLLNGWLVANLPAQQPASPGQADRLTIDQAVQEALGHNLARLADEYNLSIAEARLITARLRPNPVFSAGLDYQDILGSGFRLDPTNNAGPPEFNFRTDFILERGRKRERRIEVAEGAKDVVKLQLLESTRQLILDVESAFVDVLLARENLAVAQSSLKS